MSDIAAYIYIYIYIGVEPSNLYGICNNSGDDGFYAPQDFLSPAHGKFYFLKNPQIPTADPTYEAKPTSRKAVEWGLAGVECQV